LNSLVDIGANLTHDSFDRDRDDVIRRALDTGVDHMILTGSSKQGSLDAVALAESRPEVFHATAGVHPHHASEYDDDVHAGLQQLLANPAVVAVGECGLDYFRDFSPRAAQRVAFERQLELAIGSGLPLFLHQRDAHEDFVSILQPAMRDIAGGVAHCFTGDRTELLEYLDMGLHIGITGWICDERRGATVLQAVREIPLSRLMIETDAPYLLPRSLRPMPKNRRNEPANLTEVLRTVANAMQLPEAVVAAATTANAKQLFRLQT
jgi:TatD DNase family protein